MFSVSFILLVIVLFWPGIFGIVVKVWKEKGFDNVYSREGTYMKVVFYAPTPGLRRWLRKHKSRILTFWQMIDSLYLVPIKELEQDFWVSSYSKSKSVRFREDRGQRTQLISPNTVSSPSTDHCKVIIKAIFKVTGNSSHYSCPHLYIYIFFTPIHSFYVIVQKWVRVFHQGLQAEVFGTPDEKRSTSFFAGFSNASIGNYAVTCFVKWNNKKLCSVKFLPFFARTRLHAWFISVPAMSEEGAA